MIQIIFTYEDEQILREVAEGTEENPSQFNVPIFKVTEMIGAYLTLIEADKVTEFEDALKQSPLKMEFVGSYEMSGEQYIWTEPTESQRNHSINKYKNKLRPRNVWNEETEEFEEVEYTETTALGRQVNQILGYPKRMLN